MSKTIVALDFSSKKEALEFLANFKEPIFIKLGMELIYSEGFEIIDEIKSLNHQIFLDLKLHDIPNTVKNALKALAKKDVDIVNVHAAGGIEMMRAAKEGLMEGFKESPNFNDKNPPLCIAVTQLTSTSKETMNSEILIDGEVIDAVKKYALNAKTAGLDGVVCSVYEAKIIHEICGSEFLTITPGIRTLSDSKDDQKRVATPEFAKEMGCDFIVVGRSITKDENPVLKYKMIENIMQGI